MKQEKEYGIEEIHEMLKGSKILVVCEDMDVVKTRLRVCNFSEIDTNNRCFDEETAWIAFYKNGQIGYNKDAKKYRKSDLKEIHPLDFLSINVKSEPEEDLFSMAKFDHSEFRKSLKPFDRIIVANRKGIWRASLFSHFRNNNYGKGNAYYVYYDCSGKGYLHCRPFEGNENLIGKKYNNETGKN